MGLYLNANISLTAQHNLLDAGNNLSTSLERLSSGYRINHASDGAADLLQSENFRSQIRGMQAATRNVQQGQAMLNTADGSMQSIYDNLQRMRELAVEASNASVTNYTPYNNELGALKNNIDAIANGTVFNGTTLLNGTAPANFFIETGPNNTANDRIDIATAFTNVTTAAAGLNVAAAAFASQANAQAYITTIDNAMTTLSGKMATLGGFESEMTDRLNVLSVGVENYSAADAAVRSTDVAAESSNVVRLQIQQQAAAAALSQANMMPSIATRLLQNL